MDDTQEKYESDKSGTTTGNYIQTYGGNGASLFVIGCEIYNNDTLLNPILTKHLPLETPIQMDLRSRENVKALFAACKRYLDATEKFDRTPRGAKNE